MRTGHNQSQSVFQFFSPSPLCCVREVFAIKFPCILVSNHTPSPRLCMSMHSGSTSFVPTSAITAALPPSFVHVNALGVNFPHVRVGNHSRDPPPPPPPLRCPSPFMPAMLSVPALARFTHRLFRAPLCSLC